MIKEKTGGIPMKVLDTAILYDNPLPQLRSRHSFFPSLCRCADGRLAASVAIGQAFESVDSVSCICYSDDGGKTWTEPRPMFDKSGYDVPVTDYCKLTALPDGRLLALGYAFAGSGLLCGHAGLLVWLSGSHEPPGG
jgi:hypothetical protein